MSMTARLWSISALAVELRMDRRTVALRLRNVLPDGQLHGKPAWRLTTALDALRPRRAGPEQSDLLDCPGLHAADRGREASGPSRCRAHALLDRDLCARPCGLGRGRGRGQHEPRL